MSPPTIDDDPSNARPFKVHRQGSKHNAQDVLILTRKEQNLLVPPRKNKL